MEPNIIWTSVGKTVVVNNSRNSGVKEFINKIDDGTVNNALTLHCVRVFEKVNSSVEIVPLSTGNSFWSSTKSSFRRTLNDFLVINPRTDVLKNRRPWCWKWNLSMRRTVTKIYTISGRGTLKIKAKMNYPIST